MITFNATTATHTLPFTIWSGSAFIPQRMVWIGKASAAGDEVIITDQIAATHVWFHVVATGADFEPPQEWKRHKYESGPYGAIITTFGSGELTVFL